MPPADTPWGRDCLRQPASHSTIFLFKPALSHASARELLHTILRSVYYTTQVETETFSGTGTIRLLLSPVQRSTSGVSSHERPLAARWRPAGAALLIGRRARAGTALASTAPAGVFSGV